MFFDTSEALEAVRDALLHARPADHRPIREMSHHHDAVGGKMIRASLALTAGALLDVPRDDAIAWAATAELLHNASLIHDDMCDGDEYRRGHPAVWSKFGSAQGLCFGDWMIAQAFVFASGTKAGRALAQLAAESFSQTVEGQTLEVACAAERKYPNWDRYSRIATQKTAPLLALPVAGMISASPRLNAAAKRTTLAALNSLSDNVGFAYQINNDIDNLTQPDVYQQLTDVARATPNAVAVRFREGLAVGDRRNFDRAIAAIDPSIDTVWVPKILNSQAIGRCQADLREQLQISAEKLNDAPEIVRTMLGPVVEHLRTQLAEIPAAHAAALEQLADSANNAPGEPSGKAPNSAAPTSAAPTDAVPSVKTSPSASTRPNSETENSTRQSR